MGLFNNVSLVGRLTKDPEMRTTQSGLTVCRFNIAVNRDVRKKGVPEEERTADFPTIVAWNNMAKYIVNYCKKGTLLTVRGRIQTSSYENKDGNRVYTTEIIAEQIGALSGYLTNKDRQSENSNLTPPQVETSSQPKQSDPQYYQQNAISRMNEPTNDNYQVSNDYDEYGLNISKDDLPF